MVRLYVTRRHIIQSTVQDSQIDTDQHPTPHTPYMYSRQTDTFGLDPHNLFSLSHTFYLIYII